MNTKRFLFIIAILLMLMTVMSVAVAQTTTVAVITSSGLNLRQNPGIDQPILSRLFFGEVYTVYGQTDDGSWTQIDDNGIVGWVNSQFIKLTDASNIPSRPPLTAGEVQAIRAQNPPPFEPIGQLTPEEAAQAAFITGAILDPSILPSPPPTDPFVTITASYLNVRAEPQPWAERLFITSKGKQYPLLGINASNGWYQILVQGRKGWINSDFAVANFADDVPVVQGDLRLPEAGSNTIAKINTPVLNARSAPGLDSVVIGKVRQGEVYTVVGRNASSTWILIFLGFDNQFGWVNRGYTTATPSSISLVPVVWY